MRRQFWLVFIFFISISNLFAQENLPPAFEVLSDTVLEQRLGNAYYQMLEDKEGDWTVQQVSQPPVANLFHSRGESPKVKDTLVKTYWFRYRLKNVMNRQVQIALYVFGGQVDFYVFDKNSPTKHLISGLHVPWSKRMVIKI
jgi:hypothetical protein